MAAIKAALPWVEFVGPLPPFDDEGSSRTPVTAVPIAERPGGIAAFQAESERREREARAAAEAAYAALYPNAAALQAKADDIVNRYQSDPGLWAVWAQPEDDIVNVRVDDQTLYDTLIAEYGDDPEIVIHLGSNCGTTMPLIVPTPPPPPECAP